MSHSKIFSTRPALHKLVRTFSTVLLSICNVNIQGKGKEKNSHALQEQQVSDFFLIMILTVNDGPIQMFPSLNARVFRYGPPGLATFC